LQLWNYSIDPILGKSLAKCTAITKTKTTLLYLAVEIERFDL